MSSVRESPAGFGVGVGSRLLTFLSMNGEIGQLGDEPLGDIVLAHHGGGSLAAGSAEGGVHGEGGVEGVGLLLDVERVQGDRERAQLLVGAGVLGQGEDASRRLTTTASLATRFMPSARALTMSTSQTL